MPVFNVVVPKLAVLLLTCSLWIWYKDSGKIRKVRVYAVHYFFTTCLALAIGIRVYLDGDTAPTNLPSVFSMNRYVFTADAFKAMVNATKAQGIHFYGFSGFRSAHTQRDLYLNRMKRPPYYKQRGVARPVHSEHQLGTTVDVVGEDTSLAAASAFGNTPEARIPPNGNFKSVWFEFFAEYGMIIDRYPDAGYALL